MSDTCDAGAMSDSLSIFLMTIVCVLSIVCVALSIVVVFREFLVFLSVLMRMLVVEWPVFMTEVSTASSRGT